MAVEGTKAAVAAAATVAMAPADKCGNNGGSQWQAETEAVVGADNNQPESGSNSGGDGQGNG